MKGYEWAQAEVDGYADAYDAFGPPLWESIKEAEPQAWSRWMWATDAWVMAPMGAMTL